jgi:hypothetical protein
LEESKFEMFFDDKMLEKFSNLRLQFGPKAAADKMLGSHDIDEDYMKSQAIQYYIHGPAWRVDNTLLDRSWISGYVAACQKAGYQLAGQSFYRLSFNIDQFCFSKLDKPLPQEEPQ